MIVSLLQSANQTNDTGCYVGLAVVIGIPVAFIALKLLGEHLEMAKLSPEERAKVEKKQQDAAREYQFGTVNPEMVCPHCQTKGMVRTKRTTQKQGISGGKATAAVLTGGASLLAVGLSKKGEVTQAICEHCQCQWVF